MSLESDAPIAEISATRRLVWSVRREFWESRSLYIAPLAVAAVFLLGFMISSLHLARGMRAALALDPMKQQALIEQPYDFAALAIMGTTFLVAVFYCLDALHGERRDRSILFWKSLPVSDVTTVLSKAIIPILLLPLITFAVTVVLQLIMLLISTAVLLGSGLSAAPLWSNVSIFRMSLMLLYHLVAVHGLWYAPIFGWLLLVSAWARRAAFLWAALPLFAIGIFEKIISHTVYFGAMLASRLSGGAEGATSASGRMTMDRLMPITVGQFLSSPGLWIGLAFTAVCLAAAVRLRRVREPI
jgi:ABC-2 type transport system permease protein